MTKTICRDSGVEFESKNELDKTSYLLGYAAGAEAVNRWISVKDKLPLYKQCILFYSTDKCHGVTFGCYRGKDGNGQDWFTDYTGFTPTKDSVTHWMPLPEPPK